MNRYLDFVIASDLVQKMVLLTGPRQVGKTTLAKNLGAHYKSPLYLNFDSLTDRGLVQQANWPAGHDYVVLDEIHNMPQWKPYLKGVYDGKPAMQALLVTGSARLDTFRQTGESLAGRYFRWRLLPFSVKEFMPQVQDDAEQALLALLRFGGFPEPLLGGSDAGRARWQAQYFTDLVREDVVEFSRIHERRAMRQLVELLRKRTGSQLSFDSLGRDLGLAANTVRAYIDVLEALHIVFLVRPYHRNIARAVAKAPKLYFYDWAYVDGDDGAKLENLVATHLLKHVCFLQDGSGMELNLHYLRTTANKEIDFVLANAQGDATHFVEVKWSDAKPSLALRQMAQQHPAAQALQITRLARHASVAQGVQIQPVAAWLAQLAA